VRQFLFGLAWVSLGANAALLWAKLSLEKTLELARSMPDVKYEIELQRLSDLGAKLSLEKTYRLARSMPASEFEIQRLSEVQSWLGLLTAVLIVATMFANNYLRTSSKNGGSDG
jgi:hypothetical protein